jgi:tetratricopeptide (TPR) repeat protein
MSAADELTAQAYQAHRENRTADALKHYSEAAGIYREQNNPLRLAHTIRHVGDIYQQTKQSQLAGPFYAEALEIYRRHPETSPLDLANTLRGYALQQEATGNAAQAKLFWQEAGELYAAVNVQAGVSESERRIAFLTNA